MTSNLVTGNVFTLIAFCLYSVHFPPSFSSRTLCLTAVSVEQRVRFFSHMLSENIWAMGFFSILYKLCNVQNSHFCLYIHNWISRSFMVSIDCGRCGCFVATSTFQSLVFNKRKARLNTRALHFAHKVYLCVPYVCYSVLFPCVHILLAIYCQCTSDIDSNIQ